MMKQYNNRAIAKKTFIMKLRINKSISVLFFTIFLFSSAQCQIMPKLSSTQMMQDYSYLIEIIKKYNPQLEIRKQVQNRDIIAILKTYENRIAKCTNTKKFIALINEMLNLCNDGHLSFDIDNSLYDKDLKLNLKYARLN